MSLRIEPFSLAFSIDGSFGRESSTSIEIYSTLSCRLFKSSSRIQFVSKTVSISSFVSGFCVSISRNRILLYSSARWFSFVIYVSHQTFSISRVNLQCFQNTQRIRRDDHQKSRVLRRGDRGQYDDHPLLSDFVVFSFTIIYAVFFQRSMPGSIFIRGLAFSELSNCRSCSLFNEYNGNRISRRFAVFFRKPCPINLRRPKLTVLSGSSVLEDISRGAIGPVLCKLSKILIALTGSLVIIVIV